MAFALEPVLARDSHGITQMSLCDVRLLDNKCFPWLLLIPRRENVREWIDLTREEQHLLADEISIVSHIFKALVTPDKLNIATLGNQVPQLHVHLVGRYRHDSAWPDPVWGKEHEPYTTDEAERFIYDIRMAIESVL